MTYQFRPAQRSQAKPLIGLYSESGAGKTYSALVLARGFVGPDGVIGMIETESGRGEAYADVNEYPEIGGYQVLSLRDNFSPQAYGEAITAAEKANLDALIIDSASHEWEGAGGVLSMAAANQEAGKKGPIVWQQPKLLHQRHFMLRFMQTSVPLVILCMRAKYPMREILKNGRKEWAKSEVLEPKQADDILFEMFVHGWISQKDHKFHLTKCTAKALEPVFRDGVPIGLDTGKALAEWARGAGRPVENQSQASTADPLEEAKTVARQGRQAFLDWWNGAGKPHRATLQPHLNDLQAIVEGKEEPPEDPFGKQAETTSDSPPSNEEEKLEPAADELDAYKAKVRENIGLCGSLENLNAYWDAELQVLGTKPNEVQKELDNLYELRRRELQEAEAA